jgi:hypothetical protein
VTVPPAVAVAPVRTAESVTDPPTVMVVDESVVLMLGLFLTTGFTVTEMVTE